MSKAIAIVICNWNKKDDVLLCIESVLNSSYQDYDLYVVDNASTDGSVQAIEEEYSNRVNIIVNDGNLGGSGGFNTGIKHVLQRGYKYIQLLDNDVIIDKEAINEAYLVMEKHEEIGAVGAEIYLQKNPNKVFEFGSIIDWMKYDIDILPNRENKNVGVYGRDISECDYVPACFAMIRTKVIQDIGVMDESCFIYWDDIEWFFRIQRKEYKVVCNSKSKVWHKAGASEIVNTFAIYYFWRNRINFFLRTIDDNKLILFTDHLIKEISQAVFMSNLNEQPSIGRTILFALEDAISKKRGRAPNGRIVERELRKDKLVSHLQDKHKIIIKSNGEMNLLRSILEKIKSISCDIEVNMYSQDKLAKSIKKEYPKIKLIDVEDLALFQISLVSHILEIDKKKSSNLYIDRYQHVISEFEIYSIEKEYNKYTEIMKSIYKPVLLQRFKDWRVNHSLQLKGMVNK
ncbi:glycosyltransferase family 2 protein [Niallia sp. JL1B1071]|uniref:glycosyltransferase family 2 protein n=1 Tax=Niallia tiangongensis TaxID=3237105 RepID=UPI0037DC5656